MLPACRRAPPPVPFSTDMKTRASPTKHPRQFAQVFASPLVRGCHMEGQGHRNRRLLTATIVSLAALLPVAGTAVARPARHHAPPRGSVACSGDPQTVQTIELPVGKDHGRDTSGEYAVPARKPKGLIVFDHGHGHSVLSWTWILEHVAAHDGYIAVAMEYPGSTWPERRNPD